MAPKIEPIRMSSPSQRRHISLVAIVLVLVAAFGVVAIWPHWQRRRETLWLQKSLPTVPNTIASKVLFEQIAHADSKVRAGEEARSAIAELGRLYQANGYMDEADACWTALESVDAKDGHWPYFEADLARTRSDYTAMSTALAHTVTLAPDYAPARLRLADWQLKNGQSDAAFDNYTRCLGVETKNPYARLGLARIALQKGDRAVAETVLADLVRDTPAFSSGHDLYAEILASKGDSSGAAKQRWLGRETGRFRDADDPWLDELNERCYDYARLLVLGTRDFQTDRNDSAEVFFRRAIEVKPSAYPAYELLGRLYLKKHDAAHAREVLEEGERRVHESSSNGASLAQAKASAPSSPSLSRPSAMYFVNLSQAYRELKQPIRAVEVAQEGLAQLGDNLELEDALGIALGAEGEYNAAIDALHRALAFNANDSDSNYNLALCLRATGHEPQAIEALHRSLLLQPTFPAALLILARREMEAQNFIEAEKYIQPLYESHPEMPEVRDLALKWRLEMAKAAAARKDFDAAERHYRGAIAIDQNNPDLYSELGVMLLIAGQPDRALAWLENYFKLRPKDPRGALYLGQAYAMVGRFPEAKRVLSAGVEAAEGSQNPATIAHLREILQSLP